MSSSILKGGGDHFCIKHPENETMLLYCAWPWGPCSSATRQNVKNSLWTFCCTQKWSLSLSSKLWQEIKVKLGRHSLHLKVQNCSATKNIPYRIFITPKNVVFPMIRYLLSGDSSFGMLITSAILSDVWVSHYIHHVSYIMSGEPLMCTIHLYPD